MGCCQIKRDVGLKAIKAFSPKESSKQTNSEPNVTTVKVLKPMNRRPSTMFGRRLSQSKLTFQSHSSLEKRSRSFKKSLKAKSLCLKTESPIQPKLDQAVEFELDAKALKYPKELPVLTIPGKEVKVSVEGKFALEEDKPLTSYKGYDEDFDNSKVGSLQIRMLENNTLILVNSKGIKAKKKLPLIASLNMGEYTHYIPTGSLRFKIEGCRLVPTEKLLQGYKQFTSQIKLTMGDSPLLDERDIRLLYHFEAAKTKEKSAIEMFSNTSFPKSFGMTVTPELCEMASKLMSFSSQKNTSTDQENLKKVYCPEGKVKTIFSSFPFDMDSFLFMASKILNDNPCLLEDWSRIGICSKVAKLDSLHVVLVLAD